VASLASDSPLLTIVSPGAHEHFEVGNAIPFVIEVVGAVCVPVHFSVFRVLAQSPLQLPARSALEAISLRLDPHSPCIPICPMLSTLVLS
jgi:hypothetical protein